MQIRNKGDRLMDAIRRLLKVLRDYLFKYENLTILDLIFIALAGGVFVFVVLWLYKLSGRFARDVWKSVTAKIKSFKKKKQNKGFVLPLDEFLELKKKPTEMLTWRERRKLKKAEKHPLFGKLDAKALEHIKNFNINDIKPIDPLAEINRQINENHNNLLRSLNKKQ